MGAVGVFRFSHQGAEVSRFPTTRWTLIVDADSADSVSAREALTELCDIYWHPLYVFVRGMGHSIEDAQDLIQGFFAKFLAAGSIRSVDRSKGRFRSYVLTAVKRYIIDERARAAARKRGGDVAMVPLDVDFAEGERAYRLLAAEGVEPDRLYDRKWALLLLHRVLLRLRAEYDRSEQSERYDVLIPYVTGDREGATYTEAARRLDLSEGAVRVAVHRLRKRYFEALRLEVADTVRDESDIEGELRYLLAALRG
jgi:RNA polymerase sigma-70 factor (ECF subfamily)